VAPGWRLRCRPVERKKVMHEVAFGSSPKAGAATPQTREIRAGCHALCPFTGKIASSMRFVVDFSRFFQ